MHPGRGSAPWSLEDHPGLAPESIEIASRTGATLRGRFFRGSEGATVVVSHGYGGIQDEMLPVVSTLQAAGFNVVTYDMRGCGESSGEITLGAREPDDLRSVIDAVGGRSDVDPERIGALGFSMGAAVTIMAAASDPRIKAIVADSSWADVRHCIRPRLLDVIVRPAGRFSPLALRLLELRAGVRLRRLRPVQVVGGLRPRPLLLVHGTADETVPKGDCELLRAAAGPNAEVWMVAGAAHGHTLRPGGATSSDRISAFFAHGLCAESA